MCSVINKLAPSQSDFCWGVSVSFHMRFLIAHIEMKKHLMFDMFCSFVHNSHRDYFAAHLVVELVPHCHLYSNGRFSCRPLRWWLGRIVGVECAVMNKFAPSQSDCGWGVSVSFHMRFLIAHIEMKKHLMFVMFSSFVHNSFEIIMLLILWWN